MSNQQKIALRKWPLLIAWGFTLSLAALGYWLIQQPFEKQQLNTIGYGLAGFLAFLACYSASVSLIFAPAWYSIPKASSTLVWASAKSSG
jgi:hypothetical protein